MDSPTPETGKTGLGASQKRLLAIVGVVVVLAAAQWKFNIIPMSAISKAVVPTTVELNTADGPVTTPTTSAPLVAPCGSGLAHTGTPIRMNIWAWNAQMSLIGANCGPKTLSGSLMEKHGVTLQINRQDDTEKSKPEQIKFAQLLANGDASPAEGIQFVVIMGDGASQYLADVNKKLAKLGPEYQAEIVGAVGYSGNKKSGEDAFLGPQDWKDNPEKMRGGLVAGVLRDGDWNIAQAYLSANGIPNNPDERYYDPNALNWVNADDYLKAAEMYITGHCEDRKVVKDGKVTGDPKVNVCVNGVVTWTPGDVNIAKKKGGLVKLLSTKENYYQMPAVVIGIHKWDTSHSKQVEGLLAASFEYADQIRTYPEALQRAGRASYAVYGEESASYWVKYYNGVVERDATGQPVPLGGSRVANLGDNLFLFGLMDGGGGVEGSPFKASYEGFGNVAHTQYPTILPAFPKTSQAVNLQFLEHMATTMGPSKADTQKFNETDAIAPENTVAKRNVSIQFETGKATFTPEAQSTLDQLFTQLSVSAALSVEIDGHTDNTGGTDVNTALSLQRAEAVKTYLQNRNRVLFPENRVVTHGYGDTKPVAPNTTPEGRARNRRVTIILGDAQ